MKVFHLPDSNKATGFALCGERMEADRIRPSVKDTGCYFCRLAWEKATERDIESRKGQHTLTVTP